MFSIWQSTQSKIMSIYWQIILFAKIRDTHQKFAEKNQVIVTYQAFFQCSFRNYPGWEFGGWFVFDISVTWNIMPLITVFITTAGHNFPIEIDTGALVTLLDWKTFQKINHEPNISWLPTKSKLKTYSHEIVSPKGKSDIEFTYEGNKIETTFLITGKPSPNVPHRDILGKLQLNQKNIFHLFAASEVVSICDNVTLKKIISDYKFDFSDQLGTLKDFQADIPIDPQVTPEHFRARLVLYSLKEKIEHKLDKTRFESSLSATSSFTTFKRTAHHKHSQTLSTDQVTIWGIFSYWDISERVWEYNLRKVLKVIW